MAPFSQKINHDNLHIHYYYAMMTKPTYQSNFDCHNIYTLNETYPKKNFPLLFISLPPPPPPYTHNGPPSFHAINGHIFLETPVIQNFMV